MALSPGNHRDFTQFDINPAYIYNFRGIRKQSKSSNAGIAGFYALIVYEMEDYKWYSRK